MHELSATAGSVARRSSDVLGAACILHLATSDDRLVPLATHGTDALALPTPLTETSSSRDSVLGRVTERLRPCEIVWGDTPTLFGLDIVQDQTATAEGALLLLSVPLVIETRCSGVLTFLRPKQRPFTQTELALATRLGIDGARALDQRGASSTRPLAIDDRDLAARMRAIHRFSSGLLEAATTSDVATALIDENTFPIPATVAAVALEDRDQLLVLAARGPCGVAPRARLSRREGHPLVRALSSGQIFFVEGVDMPMCDAALAARGVSSLALSPLRVGRRIAGALMVGFSHPTIPPDVRWLVRTIARQGAHALDRIRLFEIEQRAHDRLARLAEVSALLSCTTDWTATLTNVMRALVPGLTDAAALDLGSGGAYVTAIERGSISTAVDPTIRSVPLTVGGRELGRLRLRATEAGHDEDAALRLTEVSQRIALAIDAASRERELRRAVEVRDEFIAAAGHELKTPLTSLRLSLWSLLSLGSSGPVEPDDVKHQLERFERLIDELLDVGRASAGRLALKCEEVDLAVLARDVAQSIGRGEDAPIRVEAGASVRGSWDPLRIGQVLTNLLSNAVKYGGGRPIDVVVEQSADRARVRIRDRGIGVVEEVRERIFERFERAVPGNEYPGLGLGLWISREIVSAHGGTIRVAPTTGDGTEFVLELPR